MLRGRVLDWRVCFGYSCAWWLWSIIATLGMDMDIRLDSVSPRSEAPIPVTVTLKGDRATMEGRLRITLSNGRATLLDHTTEPIVVTNTEQERRFLLPPITRLHRGQAEWRLTFETETERVEVKNLIVTLSGGDQERVAVVALVHEDETKPPVALRDVLGEGRLESLMGYSDNKKRPAAVGLPQIITWPALLKPRQLPAQALWLSAYDMVVLAPSSLADLSVFQVEGLKTWIRGGGSLLISRHPDHRLPSTAPLSKFLEELTLKGDACTVMHTDIQQALGVQLETWRWDLGRVAVLDGLEIATDSEDPQWRLLFYFLWDVRILGEVERSLDSHWNTGGLGYVTSTGSSSLLTSVLRRGLQSRLMAENVRLLPVGQLFLILLAFIALVGPVEYFVLKRLRRRWLTWILFPLTTIAVTCGAFVVAESLLGQDSTKSVTMIDLSADGKEAVRLSQAELVFSRISRLLETSHQDAFVLPVSLPDKGAPSQPNYSGSYPKDYQMERLAERWTPYMERRIGFAQGGTVPEVLGMIDWGNYHSSAMPDRKEAEGALRERLSSLQELKDVSRIRTPIDRSSHRWPKLFQVGRSWHSNGLPIRHHAARRPDFRYSEMNPAQVVPFPRLNSLRADTFLSDWILVDHEHWLITVGFGDQQTIYRYTYPTYAQ